MAGDDPNTTESGYQAGESTGWWTNNLNPAEIPELQHPQSIDVYDRMRRTDDQVLSVLRAVTLPIRRTPWRIDGAGCRDEVVALVANDLGLPVVGQTSTAPKRTKGRFDFDEHLRLALLKLPFGHSFFEQVYRFEDTDSRFHLHKLAWRPPRTILKIDTARDGGLVSITQKGLDGPDIVIPVKDLVAYVSDREGANWLGQSLLRSAYKFWLLKEMALRVQAQTNERNGMGVNVWTGADLPEGATDDEKKAELAERVKGLAIARGVRSGATTGVALAGGQKFESKGVDGRLPNPEDALTRYDDGIARSVLAHVLTLGGDNSTGSYALGNTFAEFFVASLQSVAKEIRIVIQQHVIEDLVDANWGSEEPAPQLVFDEIGSKAAIDASGIMSILQSGGLTMDDKLEEWIRNRFGMPGMDKETSRKPPEKGTDQGTPPTEEGTDQ